MSITLLSLLGDDLKSREEGVVIEVAEAGEPLARKNDDDDNGSQTELSTAVCISDSAATMLPSKNLRRPQPVSTWSAFERMPDLYSMGISMPSGVAGRDERGERGE